MFVYTAQDIASVIALGILAIVIIFMAVINKMHNWYDDYSTRRRKKSEDKNERNQENS